MEEIRNLKPVPQNEKPVPAAEVKVTSEWYEVTVGEGNYEIYVDKERNCFITQDQPREVIIPMQPGRHRLDVYSQGRFITTEGGVIGVFGEEEAEQPNEELEPEQPTEEQGTLGDPEKEPDPVGGLVCMTRETVAQIAEELHDLSEMLYDILGMRAVQPEQPKE